MLYSLQHTECILLPSFETSWVRRDKALASFYGPWRYCEPTGLKSSSQRAEIYFCRLLQVISDHFEFYYSKWSLIDERENFHMPRLRPELLFLFGNVFFQLPLDFGLCSSLDSNCYFVLEREQCFVLPDLHQQWLWFCILVIVRSFFGTCQWELWMLFCRSLSLLNATPFRVSCHERATFRLWRTLSYTEFDRTAWLAKL